MKQIDRKNKGTTSIQEVGGSISKQLEQRKQALTVKDLTSLLNVGKSAIYEMAKAGRIPHIRVGSIVRFDPATTAAWLRQQTIGTGILGVA